MLILFFFLLALPDFSFLGFFAGEESEVDAELWCSAWRSVWG